MKDNLWIFHMARKNKSYLMKNNYELRLASFFIILLSIAGRVTGQNPTDPAADFRIPSTHPQGEITAGNSKPETVNSAVVTILMNTYTYPTAISENGDYVVGMPFGGIVSYFWSASTGIIQTAGSVYGISNTGMASGTYSNGLLQYNGNNVETAGTWDPIANQWTFLGMNPAVPLVFSTDYNSGWDMSADGNSIVGMQWYPGYDVSAFKWTQSGGYNMIGAGVGLGSRASGISANGNVVYGWAEFPSASRTPVIWYNGQTYLINSAEFGEGYGASTSGNYVTGDVGNNGFLWTPQNTTLFSNTLVTGDMMPTTVLNNGTVMGYITTAWPPVPTARLAFVRDTLGNMTTFNDYAEARGLENAQQWTFYSINDAAGNDNKLIGAGKTPEGQAVTFIIEFIEEPAAFSVSPQNVDFGEFVVGTQSSFQNLVIKNAGGGNLLINSLALGGTDLNQFLLFDSNIYPISLSQGDSAVAAVAFKPTSTGVKQAVVNIQASTGNYQVPLTGTGIFAVGIIEPRDEIVSVFPNPANTSLNISFSGGLQEVTTYDFSGRLLYQKSCGGKALVTIDVGDYCNGHYKLLFTATDGSKHTASFTISR